MDEVKIIKFKVQGHDTILPGGRCNDEKLETFAQRLQEISDTIGFRISSRGWAYQLETFNWINKGQFDKVEELINTCRKKGYLPVDFIAEEEGRQFSGIEKPTMETPEEYLRAYIETVLECEEQYIPDWWDGEEFYIQLVVEKIDLKTLFSHICQGYHIPIATSKGWSSILQRASFARRFKQAEDDGKECVLLYCGDHDPDGLRISSFLRQNLSELESIKWRDGEEGYDPSNLIIDRFGLNFDFIDKNKLTWIDNLITGSGKNLADPNHPNHRQPYVQDYIGQFGVRKCEANAIVVKPHEAEELCQEAIEKYLGHDAIDRFQKKYDEIKETFQTLRETTGVQKALEESLDMII